MSATTTPETLETELTPELIERLKKLSPESRDRLIVLLGGSPLIPALDTVGDWEYWKAEIKRRVEAVEKGEVKAQTLEEAMAAVRKASRERRVVSFTVSPAATATDRNARYDRKPGRYGAALEAKSKRPMSDQRKPAVISLVEDGVHGLEIREYFIARFSQRVIYVMNGDDVLVVAVIHSDAREGAWHKNLPPATPPETA